jgi:hypothetical protein
MPWIIANIIDLLIEYDNIIAKAEPMPNPLCAASFFIFSPPSRFYLTWRENLYKSVST